MKEGAPLMSDRFKQVDLEDGICQLIIGNPTAADTGAYSCIAENKVKREQTAYFVEFEGREEAIRALTAPTQDDEDGPVAREPKKRVGRKGKGKGKDEDAAPVDMKNRLKFVAHMNDRMVPVGSKMKLLCLVDGPEPTIKWTRNGSAIVFTPRVKNLTKEGTALIEFLEVLSEDVGEWKCTAKNSFGEISSVCHLTTFEMPPTDIIPPTFSRPISGNAFVVMSSKLLFVVRIVLFWMGKYIIPRVVVCLSFSLKCNSCSLVQESDEYKLSSSPPVLLHNLPHHSFQTHTMTRRMRLSLTVSCPAIRCRPLVGTARTGSQ